MDFRKFLQRPALRSAVDSESPGSGPVDAQDQVLPYFGGPYVHAHERRLRLRVGQGSLARDRPQLRPGFYRFAVLGQGAQLLGPAEAPPLDELKGVRGHLLGARLVLPSGEVEPLYCLPEEVPPRCSPILARRWPTGELLFGQLEFEGDAEEVVRRALQDGHALSGVKAVPASLRAAFAFTVGERAAQRLGTAVSPLELLPFVSDIAERGASAAEQALARLQEERRAYALTLLQRERNVAAPAAVRPREVEPAAGPSRPPASGRAPVVGRRAPVPPSAGQSRHERSCEERAEAALHAAGATLLDSRALLRGQLEVTYRFRGQRFISIVDSATLQVVDAGVCLAGADSLVTLQSLPSVLKEAIETHRLVITRRAPGDSRTEDYDDYDD